MDELTIEDKKYVSSKRAAQMTGYAKDYVGQLCREGRVPARLVGRNWYVLESAIQDHRFGPPEAEPEPEKQVQAEDSSFFSATWQSPRYVASEESLSAVDILKSSAEPEEDLHAVEERVHDSWKEWFDRFDLKESGPEPAPEPESDALSQEAPEKAEEVAEEEEIRVPIRTYSSAPRQSARRLPPEELLPRSLAKEYILLSNLQNQKAVGYRRKTGFRAVQVFSMAFAMVMVALAAIGSGYLDSYLISHSRASMISGVILYNR